MEALDYFEVHAFTGRLFGGNPAGVCLLDRWLPDAVLQQIAAENNLSETAYLVERDGTCILRWFTPTIEVELCGHATLAAAHVLARHRGRTGTIRFHTQSGVLPVQIEEDRLVLDFPARPAQAIAVPTALISGLGSTPLEVWRAPRDLMAVLPDERAVRRLAPDFCALAELDSLGIIVTAPGVHCDFVSRFFAPRAGIAEDPVTGSAHCTLMPYWTTRLGRSRLEARQVSARGGELSCELLGDRVRIAGRAVTYLEGRILVPKFAPPA